GLRPRPGPARAMGGQALLALDRRKARLAVRFHRASVAPNPLALEDPSVLLELGAHQPRPATRGGRADPPRARAQIAPVSRRESGCRSRAPPARGSLDSGALADAGRAGHRQLLRPLEPALVQRGLSRRAPRPSPRSLEPASPAPATRKGVLRLALCPSVL